MAVSDEYVDFVLEQIEGAGEVLPKRMFGGVGLYLDGLFFALVAADVLYFKVDDDNRADFEAAGMGAFRPYKNKNTTMSYYEVPIDVLENRQELARWSQKALQAARQAQVIPTPSGDPAIIGWNRLENSANIMASERIAWARGHQDGNTSVGCENS